MADTFRNIALVVSKLVTLSTYIELLLFSMMPFNQLFSDHDTLNGGKSTERKNEVKFFSHTYQPIHPTQWEVGMWIYRNTSPLKYVSEAITWIIVLWKQWTKSEKNELWIIKQKQVRRNLAVFLFYVFLFETPINYGMKQVQLRWGKTHVLSKST